ncbi:MAG: hypothetical protein BA865_14440 [Desulfobacterales bacterium S5133MH4]|nr:MAG: hypothetical protein BA865_14440 [Desulfobacterales bacterium S5133MH4]
MPYQPVFDCNQIDLTRHGLIEASAGTGKTYTIENLVVRLLKERNDIALENILLVTFTEKATCELKIRIREKLEKELKDSKGIPEIATKIREALDTFDKASIFTIHGFCQTVLRDFAFENRAPFQSEVINDAPLFERLLKEQMRKRWPEIYQEHLKEVLEISNFNKKKDSFVGTVTGLANSFHERAGDRLLPNLEGRGYQEIKEEIRASCMKLKALIGSDGKLSEGFGQLNIHGGTRKSLLAKIINPLEDFFTQVDEDNLSVKALVDLISQIQKAKSKDKKGTRCLDLDWGGKGPNPEVCPNLETIKENLEELIVTFTGLQNSLAIQAIHQLQKDVSQAKQSHGWISYYDMLALVEQALYDDNSSGLLEKLRNRYKVAFIDEFQDTDPVQWKIFKRIFIDNQKDSHENLLYLIGDPKQAIYSFRGADVYAYLSAKNEIRSLEKADKAKLYSLSINWRSQPELITAFDHLFCRQEWFKPHSLAGVFEIGYQAAGFPEEEDRLSGLIEDYSGRPVLNIVDLSEATSPKPAKPRLARFIALEIRHLVNSGIRLKEKHEGERKLGFGDICILVRSKFDVPLIEEELSTLGIPYTFYKKPGLFLSDEAVYLSLVFHAILDPGNSSEVKKALLTPFFGFGLSNLFAYEELSPSHALKQMLFKWNEYALARKWSRLFQSLMEDSGLLSRETGTSVWDRKYTNYRQIFEYLEGVAYTRNLDFRGLSATLDTYRKQSVDAGEDADIHQIETEARKVQIMTMHVSKGLQFPVVFIAGGLTQPPSHRDHYHTYHEIQEKDSFLNAIKIVDLAKLGGREKHEAEKGDENKRLYYVASTRSQYKLYLPFYLYEKNQPWVGPVCCLLSPALDNSFPRSEDNKNVLWLRADHHSGVSEDKPEPDETEEHPTIPITDTAELFPSQRDYQYRKIRLESFSSLHSMREYIHGIQEQKVGFQAVQEKAKEDDESFASQSAGAMVTEGTPAEMPGGTDVGLMFHDILESIDYEAVLRTANEKGNSARSLLDNPRTRDIILNQMEIYRVDERWQERICGIIWNTLTTPIRPVADDFILAQLKEEERLHEVEFYYPFSFPVNEPEKIPDCEIANQYIRGFVDLVFKHNKKFYIADWKSNYIESGYDQQSMEINMNHADYHLQYKLYTVAVLRWLKQAMDDRFDPEKNFGGILYFYLRGMGTGNGNGIYYVPADELRSLEELEREVAGIIK